MTDKTKTTKKEVPQPQYIGVPTQYNSPEVAKLGEITLSSEILRSDALLSCIMVAIKDPAVVKYLQITDAKKKAGSFVA